MIESGFRLPWAAVAAPLRSSPIPSRLPASSAAREALHSEILSLLAKGAIEEVPLSSPGFYGRIFVVPKTLGGFRPVLDLSALNAFLRVISFRMETAASVRAAVRPGDWAASLDLKDAYFHIPIFHRDRKWLRFHWEGRSFQFTALPFGLSLAPWVFTRIIRELCIAVRRQGIRLHAYLDDWLILADSEQRCALHTSAVLRQAQDLGFLPNWDKSDLSPSQSFTFLGMEFDTALWSVRPSQVRSDRLGQLLSQLLSTSSASARSIAALLGQMESLAPLVPLGRLHKRELQRQFRMRWSQASQPWDRVISLENWFAPTVTQWTVKSWVQKGVPISPPHTQEELYTDASVSGWGAHVGSHSASGLWSPCQKDWHINRLELEAVWLAVQAFKAVLMGKHILLCTDNTTVACYVNKQGGARSSSLSKRTEDLLMWCSSQGVSLSARHVPGKLNILADFLSRPHTILHTEWTLAHQVLQPVWDLWHKPMIDLFATSFNHRLPLYVSPVPDPEAWAVDALSFPWKGLSAYAFPPLPILSKVLRKARMDLPQLILIAPRWPAQPWFPDLLQLCHTPPLKLHVTHGGLLQPRSGIEHGNPAVLDLHAWRLCGGACNHPERLATSGGW